MGATAVNVIVADSPMLMSVLTAAKHLGNTEVNSKGKKGCKKSKTSLCLLGLCMFQITEWENVSTCIIEKSRVWSRVSGGLDLASQCLK